MQSLQPGSVRDRSLMLDRSQSPNSSPSRSPERSLGSSTPTVSPQKEQESESHFLAENASPPSGTTLTPILRPAAWRPPPQSILGENTPPQSSTLLALQNMPPQSSSREVEFPLSNITNGPSCGIVKGSPTMDNLSKQLLSLTNIAKSLQKEMTALSRRSKDNATDLLSLKQVTSTRDEDIRKSLRNLLENAADQSLRLSSHEHFSGLFLDNKPHSPGSTNKRSVQLPRIPSPKSFSESIDSHYGSAHSVTDGQSQATLSILESIVRDMGTKEGQETLISRLTEISEKLSGMASASKVDELIRDVRSQMQNAVVPVDAPASIASIDQIDRAFNPSEGGPMTRRVQELINGGAGRRSSAPPERGAELLNDDLMKIIRSVKDSVAQGGGLTAEVKALVRELRGEVLGMGREIGRRLEQVAHNGVEDSVSPSKDEVSRVIDEGLEQMKDQLNHVLREHRRQSAASASSQKTAVDYQEIYNAMRAALRDNEASRGEMPDLSREDVIEAVRNAWAEYKPEVEAQQMGLQREDVLACLKEGLEDYLPGGEKAAGATREEVFEAVVEGLKHFVPPPMDTSATLSRDEIVEAVRDCLEEFEFPVAASAIGNDFRRADMVHAVKEGLQGLNLSRGSSLGTTVNDEMIMSRLREITDYMKLEFKAASEEAKENLAANGRDTEHILDVTKDGFENLRLAMESYVDRAAGASGQEHLFEALMRSLEEFKEKLSQLLEANTSHSREHLREELEGLRDVVHSSMVPHHQQSQGHNNQEVLEALQTGMNTIRQEILRPRADTGEIIDALHDGLNELRAGIERISNKPIDLTANDEVLDALKSGIESVRSDIDSLRQGGDERAVAAIGKEDKGDTHAAVVPLDVVKQGDIKNLEVLIAQLRIKVEAIAPDAERGHEGDSAKLEEMLRNVQEGIDKLSSREPQPAKAEGDDAGAAGDYASRDDVQAIETILRNTKSRLDDLIDDDQAVRKGHLDALEMLILETKESLGVMQGELDSLSRKEDVSVLESLISQISLGFDEMRDRAGREEENPEKVSKADVEAVEKAVLEVKSALEGADLAALTNKGDLTHLETVMQKTKENLDVMAEAAVTAMEERQAEIVGVGERVSDVKALLEEFQDTVRSQVEEGATGVDGLAKVLEAMSETVNKNENVGQDVKEMFEMMKTEFEDSKSVVAGAKLESDQKLQEAAETIGTRIDDKFTELIDRYAELESVLEEKIRAGEARDAETEAAILGTKAVAEELKSLIDTLGSSVTDSLERMEEASKTVFDKVEDLVTLNDSNHAEGKAEHEQTRNCFQQALLAVEGMQGEMSEYQPKILEAVKDVLLLVGEHFEHSKSSSTDIQDKIVESRAGEQAMLPAPERYDDSEVQAKLNRLAEQKYDDAGIHEKLDKLVNYNEIAREGYGRLEQLDKVHESVTRTAAEISDFLSSQTARAAHEDEEQGKILRETSAAAERKIAERDHLETLISSLRSEEDRLRNSVVQLRTEQESLIRQKTRLTGDVSSLQTAMRLRKEDLSEMEGRAERLERRIIEGVMDHSRVLLMSKGSRKGENMSRKRVKKKPTTAAAGGGEQASEQARAAPQPAVSMALSTKRNTLAGSAASGAARRIVSLSQMHSNLQSAAVKRSQSVRVPAGGPKALRKRSWGGDLAKAGLGEADKENIGVREAVEEMDEPESTGWSSGELLALIPHPGRRGGDDAPNFGRRPETDIDEKNEDDGDDDESDTGTLRRSIGGEEFSELATGSDTCSGCSGCETASDWTESALGAVKVGI